MLKKKGIEEEVKDMLNALETGKRNLICSNNKLSSNQLQPFFDHLLLLNQIYPETKDFRHC